jgi:hypothetical protein
MKKLNTNREIVKTLQMERGKWDKEMEKREIEN